MEKKARGDHVFPSNGKTNQTIILAFHEEENSNRANCLITGIQLCITFILIQRLRASVCLRCI